MVTYSYTTNDVPGSTDFETIAAAFDAAGADIRAEAGVVPVSIDDHEGNLYDAATIQKRFAPRGDD